MSFLNPVSEPVLRFSSTDAGAPQINYNARTAGDVKAVLKACLVTGYGAKASAGWTAVNETATVIEFVSPSAAMSDYRLGIDDTSASSTTWYYRYKDIRVNPTNNVIVKALTRVDKTHADNGWQLLVAGQGLYFIESVQSTVIGGLVSRVTYIGQLKSALSSADTINMAFWSVGHDAADPDYFFIDDAKGRGLRYIALDNYADFDFAGVAMHVIQQKPRPSVANHINIMSDAFLTKGTTVIAQHPGLLLEASSANDALGVANISIPAPMLRVNVTFAGTSLAYYRETSKPIYIRTDNWEY